MRPERPAIGETRDGGSPRRRTFTGPHAGVRRCAFLAVALAAACSIPPVQTGVNPVNGCATDGDCPKGYHCAAGACQLMPRTCKVDPQCDQGQSCQNGNCLPANRTFCQPCDTSSDCAVGGLCVSFAGSAQFCSMPCGSGCASAGGQCLMTTDANGNDAGVTCLPENGNCSGGTNDGGTGPAATFTFINQNLIQGEGCTVCHAAGAGPSFANLDLATNPYAAIVGVPAINMAGSVHTQADGGTLLIVAPGDPGESFFLTKLGLTQKSSQYGQPMPMTTPASTPPALMNAVQSWIAAGAPNN